jgi:ribosomal protein S14
MVNMAIKKIILLPAYAKNRCEHHGRIRGIIR